MAATSLIVSGLIAAGSEGLSAYNLAQDRKREENDYGQFRSYLDSLYYRDPLTTVSNQALLKGVRQNHADEIDAVQNRMAAGGGTMENALAARQASNEGLDKVQTQLLLGEDARRDRIAQQKLALDQQHSLNVRNSYRQAAQDWQSWGAQTAGAMMSYGASDLLGGELSGREWSKLAPSGDVLGAMASRIDNADLMTPIATGAPKVATPGVTGPALGGLKGVNR